MMILIMGVSIMVYFCGLISFTLNRKHLLLMLLSLELIVLGLYFNLYLFLTCFDYDYYFGMIFLTMSVCEGSLGLSILVSLIRTHGNDFFQSFNILW